MYFDVINTILFKILVMYPIRIVSCTYYEHNCKNRTLDFVSASSYINYYCVVFNWHVCTCIIHVQTKIETHHLVAEASRRWNLLYVIRNEYPSLLPSKKRKKNPWYFFLSRKKAKQIKVLKIKSRGQKYSRNEW